MSSIQQSAVHQIEILERSEPPGRRRSKSEAAPSSMPPSLTEDIPMYERTLSELSSQSLTGPRAEYSFPSPVYRGGLVVANREGGVGVEHRDLAAFQCEGRIDQAWKVCPACACSGCARTARVGVHGPSCSFTFLLSFPSAQTARCHVTKLFSALYLCISGRWCSTQATQSCR